jgi:hypothetical protein
MEWKNCFNPPGVHFTAKTGPRSLESEGRGRAGGSIPSLGRRHPGGALPTFREGCGPGAPRHHHPREISNRLPPTLHGGDSKCNQSRGPAWSRFQPGPVHIPGPQNRRGGGTRSACPLDRSRRCANRSRAPDFRRSRRGNHHRREPPCPLKPKSNRKTKLSGPA